MRIPMDWGISWDKAVDEGAPSTDSCSDVRGLVTPKPLGRGRTLIDTTAVRFVEGISRKALREYGYVNGQRPAHPLELMAVAKAEAWLASDFNAISLALIALTSCKDTSGTYGHYWDDWPYNIDVGRVYIGVRYIRPNSARSGNTRLAHAYWYDEWPRHYWFLFVDDPRIQQRRLATSLNQPSRTP